MRCLKSHLRGLATLGLALAVVSHVTSTALAQPLEDAFDDPRGGGDGSVMQTGSESFSLPFKGSTREHHTSFIIGNSLFKENWVPSPSSVHSRQGLGPLLNAQSCSSCHFKDGRGMPPESVNEVPVGLLLRISVPGKSPVGGPNPHPIYGDQLRHRSILGVQPEADFAIDYKLQSGKFADGSDYELREPVIKVTNPRLGPIGKDTLMSARIAPQMIGLGLLEAIDERSILANADADDKDGDGISGRPNWTWNLQTKKRALGRFGWKASQPTVMQQSAGAFSGDMGITSDLFAKNSCPPTALDCLKVAGGPGPEISKKDLRDVTIYSQLLAVPYRRNIGDATTLKGRTLFQQANCQSCHASQFTTGTVAGFPELSHQRIHPYTDLLLHDMGPGLADNRSDFEATGTEWRTAPLWGVGLIEDVNGKTRLLHDGRARSVSEAILWHGGEADRSRDAFKNMSREERDALVKFVESL